MGRRSVDFKRLYTMSILSDLCKIQYLVQTMILTQNRCFNRYDLRSDNSADRVVNFCRLPPSLTTSEVARYNYRKTFIFLTNNFILPAQTVADLYKHRWQVIVFQINKTVFPNKILLWNIGECGQITRKYTFPQEKPAKFYVFRNKAKFCHKNGPQLFNHASILVSLLTYLFVHVLQLIFAKCDQDLLFCRKVCVNKKLSEPRFWARAAMLVRSYPFTPKRIWQHQELPFLSFVYFPYTFISPCTKSPKTRLQSTFTHQAH